MTGTDWEQWSYERIILENERMLRVGPVVYREPYGGSLLPVVRGLLRDVEDPIRLSVMVHGILRALDDLTILHENAIIGDLTS